MPMVKHWALHLNQLTEEDGESPDFEGGLGADGVVSTGTKNYNSFSMYHNDMTVHSSDGVAVAKSRRATTVDEFVRTAVENADSREKQLMPPDFIVFTPVAVNIEPLVGYVDSYLTEEHSLNMDITDHPVESGSSIVDNAVKRPDILKVTAVVSDGLSNPETYSMPPEHKATELWYTLRDLMEQRQLLTIVTRLYTYDNMLLRSVSAPIDGNMIRGLKVTLEFQELITVRTTTGRFTDANVGGVATDRTSVVDGGTKSLVDSGVLAQVNNFDIEPPESATNPFTLELGTGLTIGRIEEIAEATDVPVENISLIDRAKQLFRLGGDVTQILPQTLRWKLDNALNYSIRRARFGAILAQFSQFPFSNNNANQTFALLLDGLETRAHLWWQPDDVNWYSTLNTADGRNLMQSKRLNGNGRPMFGMIRQTPGEMWISGTSDPGRNAWGNSHHAYWASPQEVATATLDAIQTEESVDLASRLLAR